MQELLASSQGELNSQQLTLLSPEQVFNYVADNS
jgi:hypothetical protein